MYGLRGGIRELRGMTGTWSKVLEHAINLKKRRMGKAAAAEQKRAMKPSNKKALGAALGVAGVAVAGIVYGRVRPHSSPHSAVNATGEERRNALMGHYVASWPLKC